MIHRLSPTPSHDGAATVPEDRVIARTASWLARFGDLPARTALKLSNRPAIRRMMGARHAADLDRHQPLLPRLTGIDREIVDALTRDGVFVTTLDALALPGSDEAMQSARRMADDFAEQARRLVREGSDFNVVPAAALIADPAIFIWGLGDRLLDIAEAYIGLPVAYDGVSINYTVADGREVSTRKWHRDWEDRRMLKVAVYLNDVDSDGGPFEMIRRSDTGQDDLAGYRYELASDAELEALLGEGYRDDIASCTGPAGTVVFTDTARYFHRGRPCISQDRKAVFYSYFARRPRHPYLCERSGLSRRDIATLSAGISARQQAVTRWRDELPWFVRMIPSARI